MTGGSQVIALQQSMSAQHRGHGWTLLHLQGMIIRNLQPRSWTYPVGCVNILQMYHSTLCTLYWSWCSFIAEKMALRTESISLQTTITVKWLAFRPRTRFREFPYSHSSMRPGYLSSGSYQFSQSFRANTKEAVQIKPNLLPFTFFVSQNFE